MLLHIYHETLDIVGTFTSKRRAIGPTQKYRYELDSGTNARYL